MHNRICGLFFVFKEVISIKLVFKKSKKLIIKIIIFSIIAYIVFLFINQQVKIKQKRDELANINEQIKTEKQKKDELMNSSEYEDGENKKDSSKVRVFENVME